MSLQSVASTFVPCPGASSFSALRGGIAVFGGILFSVACSAMASAPYAATQPAVQISGTAATLAGMAVPNGQNARAWFEWGNTLAFGQTNSGTEVGSGTGVVRVTSPIAGLTPGEVYAFRLVVSNASGVVYGAPQTFATGKKVAAWGGSIYGLSSAPAGLTQTVAVACGYYTSLAVDVQGKVKVWGSDAYNQTNVPPGLDSVVAVAGGFSYSLALRANGTIVGWGDNYSNLATPPASATNVIAIAAGRRHSVALKGDGSVAAWGDNFFQQTNTPAGLANVVAVACGDNHSLALLADGTVRAWGDNIFDQTTVPAGLANVVAIAGGSGHSMALKADGTVVTWGWPFTTPSGLQGVTSLAGGWTSCLALKGDRTVTSWGGGAGELPPGLVNVASIAAAGQHGLAISDNTPPIATAASISCQMNRDLTIELPATDPNGDPLSFWITQLPDRGALYQYVAGGRGNAIIAPGTAVSDSQGRVIFVPPAHAFGSPFTSFAFKASDGAVETPEVAATIYVIPTMAATRPVSDIKGSGAMLNGIVVPNGEQTYGWFEWGANGSFDQVTTVTDMGSTNTLVRLQQALVGLVPNTMYRSRLVVSNEAVGVIKCVPQSFTTGLRLAVLGSNLGGQGNFPVATSDIVAVAAGGSHSLAIRNGGTVLAWGLNTYGQTNVPANLTNVVAVAAGGSHSLALLGNGKVVGWGRNNFGQTNIPVNLTNAVAIAAGVNTSLAVRSDGRIVVWGDGSAGQTNMVAPPVNVIAVSAGMTNCFALRVDGSVRAWGAPAGGVLNVPAAATNITAISAGNYHVLALKSDGRVIAWGTNNYGQTSVPSDLTNVVAISAGANHSLALKADGTVVSWGLGSSGQTNLPAGLMGIAAAGGESHTVLLGNVAPVAQPAAASGYVSHDVVVGLSASDLNKETNFLFRIISLPFQGVFYQYDQGARGALIGPGNSVVSDPLGRVIFAPAAGSLDASYAYFVANDGIADSAPGMMTIVPGLPAAPMFSSGTTTFANSACTVTFAGTSNATYSVWGSTNLTTWDYLGTASPLPGSQYQFQDTNATSWPRRFYRATAP